MKRSYFTTTRERGAAGLKAIIAVAILGAAIYAGVIMVPIYAAHYGLEDKIKEDILFASQRFRRAKTIEEGIKKAIDGYLNEMEAEYEKKNVRVKHDSGKRSISVELWYTRQHKIPFFPHQFSLQLEGKYGL